MKRTFALFFLTIQLICSNAQVENLSDFGLSDIYDAYYPSSTYNKETTFTANQGSVISFTFDIFVSGSSMGHKESVTFTLDGDTIPCDKFGDHTSHSVLIKTNGTHTLHLNVEDLYYHYRYIYMRNITIDKTITDRKGHYFFKKDDGTLKLAYMSTYSRTDSVFVPSEVSIPFDGKYTISEIGDSAFKDVDVQYLSLPSTITKIYTKALIDSKSLTRVDCYPTSAPYVYSNSFPEHTKVHVDPKAEWYDTDEWSYYDIIYDLGVIYANRITVAKKIIGLNVGETYNASYSILPDDAYYKTVTWKSARPEIVSVNQNGVIKAETPGTSVVTITTTDGTNISDTCYVVSIGGEKCADLGLPSGNIWKIDNSNFHLQWAALTYPQKNSSPAPYTSNDPYRIPVNKLTKYNTPRIQLASAKLQNVFGKALTRS